MFSEPFCVHQHGSVVEHSYTCAHRYQINVNAFNLDRILEKEAKYGAVSNVTVENQRTGKSSLEGTLEPSWEILADSDWRVLGFQFSAQ